MKTDIISPKVHGLADYAFVAVLFTVPSILSLNIKSKNLYAVLGSNLLVYNAFTDHPVSVKRLITYDGGITV